MDDYGSLIVRPGREHQMIVECGFLLFMLLDENFGQGQDAFRRWLVHPDVWRQVASTLRFVAQTRSMDFARYLNTEIARYSSRFCDLGVVYD